MNRADLRDVINAAIPRVEQVRAISEETYFAQVSCLIAKAQLNALQDIATALEKIAEQQSDSDAEEPAQ